MNNCCTTSEYAGEMNRVYISPAGRSFLTRQEKIDLLKEYKEQLDLESKGVGEKIAALEKAEANN